MSRFFFEKIILDNLPFETILVELPFLTIELISN